MAKQKTDRRFADKLRRLLPVLLDLGHVDVGNEIIRVGALEYEHLDRVVGLGALDERDQIANQLGSQKIHRRSRNLHEQDGPFLAYLERFVFQVVVFGPAFSHFSSCCVLNSRKQWTGSSRPPQRIAKPSFFKPATIAPSMPTG